MATRPSAASAPDTAYVPTLTDPAPVAPSDPSERAELLDGLRGFALFGVCVSNLMASLAQWDVPVTRTLQRWTLPTDGAATFLMEVLVEGKFYSIFSLLFGLGFALLLQRAEARGGDGMALYRRRTRILMLIGFAHLVLLWMGDILLFYGLMAIVLVRMRHLSDARVVRWAAALVLLPLVLYLPTMISMMISIALPFFIATFGMITLYGVDMERMQDTMFAWYASGNIVEWFKLTTVGVFLRFADLLFTGRPFKVLAMFLVGMLVGRHRVWAELDVHAPLLKRVAIWAAAIGLPSSIGWALLKDGDALYSGSISGLAQTALYATGVAPLALAYAAGLALLWRAGHRGMLRMFAPAGRMALTNYLSQTVIAVAIFSGFGLALAGRVGPTLLWAQAIATVALQIVWSRWWLARYRFGPLEWVWRSLTYRVRQPLAISERPPPVPAG